MKESVKDITEGVKKGVKSISSIVGGKAEKRDIKQRRKSDM
jgi:hypothetical protein